MGNFRSPSIGVPVLHFLKGPVLHLMWSSGSPFADTVPSVNPYMSAGTLLVGHAVDTRSEALTNSV